jgi:dienelactone hydrolase
MYCPLVSLNTAKPYTTYALLLAFAWIFAWACNLPESSTHKEQLPLTGEQLVPTGEQPAHTGEVSSPTDEQPAHTEQKAEVTQDKLQRHEFVLFDRERVTPEAGKEPELAERRLRLLVWVGPMTSEWAGKYPLLVMAHGLGGLPDKFEAFAQALANAGVVVAALQFPLTNQNAPAGSTAGMHDLLNQPGDVSFVITWLLQSVSDAESALYKRFDANKLAVLGHSYGGATVLGLTRYDCCLDKRVWISILVAAATQLNAIAFRQAAPNSDGPPTLIIHGRDDHIINYASSEKLYPLLSSPCFFLGIPDTGHSDLLESQTQPPDTAREITQRAVKSFIAEFLMGEKGATTKELAELSKSGCEIKH